MKTIEYRAGDNKYAIPPDRVADFEEAFPEAIKIYKAGDNKYGIPLNRISDFEEAFPEANCYNITYPKGSVFASMTNGEKYDNPALHKSTDPLNALAGYGYANDMNVIDQRKSENPHLVTHKLYEFQVIEPPKPPKVRSREDIVMGNMYLALGLIVAAILLIEFVNSKIYKNGKN